MGRVADSKKRAAAHAGAAGTEAPDPGSRVVKNWRVACFFNVVLGEIVKMTAVESGPSIGRKFKLIAWLPICGFLVIPACGERNVYAPPPPPKVTVSQPVLRSVVDYLEFTGNTQAINTVELRARVQGYLEKVYFKDGDVVKKGQRAVPDSTRHLPGPIEAG